MIKLTNISISDFYSLEEANFEYNHGIYKVVGVLDGDPNASNGAGKSSALVAPQQALYNTNCKDAKAKIDETYNRVTGRPYSISLQFTKDDTEYTVINNRAKNSITIIENGNDISVKGVPRNLALLTDIIGVDFKVFSSLTYLSQKTMANVLDLTNEDNVLYSFFDIDKIKGMETRMKSRRKEAKDFRLVELTRIETAESTKATLENYRAEDAGDLELSRSKLLAALSAIEGSVQGKKYEVLKAQLTKEKSDLSDLAIERTKSSTKVAMLQEQLEEMATGSCPTCGQDIITNTSGVKAKITKEDKTLEDIMRRGKVVNTTIKRLSAEASGIQTELSTKRDSFNRQLTTLSAKILAIKERTKEFQAIQTDLDALEKSITTSKQVVKELGSKMVYFDTALQSISSGALMAEYLNSFTAVFNAKLVEMIELTEVDISIRAVETKGKLVYKFIKDGKPTTFNGLSTGEQTRTAFIILMAITQTLETLTGVSIDYVVFDELLSVLDKKGILMLTKVLDKFRESKTIYVVLHHNEIEQEFFDGTMTVHNTGGIARIEI